MKIPFLMNRFMRLLGVTVALLTAFAAHAQPLQNALFTAGTSAEDSNGDDWAFLLFQLTTSAEDLFGRRLAIHTKPGGLEDPGTFAHTGNIALQTNPTVIKVLLNRAAALGQAPGDLNLAIDELFGELVPAEELPVEEKLSAVIRGSIEDPRTFANLMFLARMHPGVSLALGLAHAQRIGPGLTTFEVRELGIGDAETGVVGRVVVEAGNPVVLPAPGGPVEVPEMSPKGHLNARLRWGVEEPLRRLSLLQYGFNVYRVAKASAENYGWDETPPPAGLLAALAPGEDDITLINRTPVLPSALFDPVTALDLAADPSTFFIADDNGLVQTDAVPFKDGDRFYFFVTARDVLGRDGETSPGTEIMIKDRIPPNAPRMPEVVNDTQFIGGEEDTRLKVIWRQSPSTPDEPISGYYVYRWATPGDVQKFAINPLVNRISGFIPHVPGQTHLSFIDNGDGAPTATEEFLDKTFWYTIRAFKPTKEDGILSPNSAPAFGVLRNRDAPEGPDGQIFIICCLPEVEPDRVEDVPSTVPNALDPLRFVIDLVATRSSSKIAWAEFAINDTRDPEGYIGRFDFAFMRFSVATRVSHGRARVDGTLTVYCRVGDAAGNISEWVELSERGLPEVGFLRRHIFAAHESCEEVLLDAQAITSGCKAHSPGGIALDVDGFVVPDNGENPSNPIKVKFGLKDRAEDYRVYRRVDQGDLTLWRQGLADEAEANEIVLSDGALPPNAGEVAYFGQLLDEHGNASELKLLGTHVAVAQPAPSPLLGPPEIAGTQSQPRMKIRWFCPPDGVDRFAVLLGVPFGAIPLSIDPDLANNSAPPGSKISLQNATPNNNGQFIPYGAYLTPSLEAGFGPGPDYELSIPVTPGKIYYIQIRAIAKNGGEYRHSKPYKFVWPSQDIDALTGPDVPWPARPLPEVRPVIDNRIQAIRVSTNDFNGLGVVIGEIPSEVTSLTGNLIDPQDDFRSYLFNEGFQDGNELFPIQLYRYQVASEAFPTPSGDLIQVTPVMTEIASAATAAERQNRDPFIRIYRAGSAPDPSIPFNIVLLDYQPAIRTASYAYVMVRYLPNGEIAAVHPIDPINVAF